MTKINWKVRVKNPTFWLTFIPVVLSFIYSVLALLGITPSISENEIMDVATMLVSILAGLGILVDPTTAGIGDSEQALTYDTPKK